MGTGLDLVRIKWTSDKYPEFIHDQPFNSRCTNINICEMGKIKIWLLVNNAGSLLNLMPDVSANLNFYNFPVLYVRAEDQKGRWVTQEASLLKRGTKAQSHAIRKAGDENLLMILRKKD